MTESQSESGFTNFTDIAALLVISRLNTRLAANHHDQMLRLAYTAFGWYMMYCMYSDIYDLSVRYRVNYRI